MPQITLGERFEQALKDKMAEVVKGLKIDVNGKATDLANRTIVVDTVEVRLVFAVADVNTGETQAVGQEYQLLLINGPFTKNEQVRILGFRPKPLKKDKG